MDAPYNTPHMPFAPRSLVPIATSASPAVPLLGPEGEESCEPEEQWSADWSDTSGSNRGSLRLLHSGTVNTHELVPARDPATGAPGWTRGQLAPITPTAISGTLSTLGVASSPGTLPPVVRALLAREAALQDDRRHLRGFTDRVLGLWSGWNEAVSTALLGDWASPLSECGALGPADVERLRRDIRTAHRHLTPLWRRRTYGGRRVVLLETQCGDSLTLRDLLSEGACPEDHLLDLIPDDPRLARILTALEPGEREVVLALGLRGIETWWEAAEYASSKDPRVFGERVRRKVRRLAAELSRRDAQQSASPASRLRQLGKVSEGA